MFPNYELITGPFAGSIVEEGQKVLDISYEEMDSHLKQRITEFAKDNEIADMDEAIDAYEASWESIKTNEEADLLSLSSW